MSRRVKTIVVALLLSICSAAAAQELSHTTPPIVIHKVHPRYTSEGLAAKITGSVLIGVTIGVDGIPARMKVTRGPGRGLDEKAIECAAQWRFKPATRNGEPVAVGATIEIYFRLPK